MLSERRRRAVRLRRGVGKAPDRTNGLERPSGWVIDLVYHFQFLHLGMSDERGVI